MQRRLCFPTSQLPAQIHLTHRPDIADEGCAGWPMGFGELGRVRRRSTPTGSFWHQWMQSVVYRPHGFTSIVSAAVLPDPPPPGVVRWGPDSVRAAQRSLTAGRRRTCQRRARSLSGSHKNAVENARCDRRCRSDPCVLSAFGPRPLPWLVRQPSCGHPMRAGGSSARMGLRPSMTAQHRVDCGAHPVGCSIGGQIVRYGVEVPLVVNEGRLVPQELLRCQIAQAD